MATVNEKIPCGGFLFDSTVFEFKKDVETGQPALTVTANVPTTGADFIILKSSESAKQFKITVNDAGNLSATEVKD